MLSFWRRHLKSCSHGKKGRSHTKCSCPIWCDGEIDGRRYRHSLETCDWQRAIRKLAALEDPMAPRQTRCRCNYRIRESHPIARIIDATQVQERPGAPPGILRTRGPA